MERAPQFKKNFILVLLILFESTIMSRSSESSPFSFDEIEAIPDFNLKKPEYLLACDNQKLAYYSFLPENFTQVVIFLHGAGLYNNKTYQSIGLKLSQSDIACYMLDLRGHGYSQGPRGDSPTIEHVYKDIDSLISLVKSKHANTQIYLAGHSSGAGLILNYNNYHNNNVISGYFLFAPYLGPQSGTLIEHKDKSHSFVKKFRLWVYILNNILNINAFKHITSVVFNYPKEILDQDPLIVSSYSYTMSCATTPYDINLLFSKVDKPFGIYIGEFDEQFIPEKVVAYKKLVNTVSDKSISQIIPGDKHLSILLSIPDIIKRDISKLTK